MKWSVISAAYLFLWLFVYSVAFLHKSGLETHWCCVLKKAAWRSQSWRVTIKYDSEGVWSLHFSGPFFFIWQTVEFLAPKGTFVSKVFRSQDYNAILYCFKQLFEKVEVTKPVANRSTSVEIYVVGLRYKAPSKIDPRLLDVKHIFQQVVDICKTIF